VIPDQYPQNANLDPLVPSKPLNSINFGRILAITTGK